MSWKTLCAIPLLSLAAAGFQTPLPELRTEPVGGGSVFFVRNTSTQPLAAFLIELVDYPGSSYALFEDYVTSEAIPPGGEKRIPVNNMTVGAVPDYVKIRAAVYADGAAAGLPDKVNQIVERRRAALATTRELIGRLEKGQSAADLKQWAASLRPAGRALIVDTVSQMENHSRAEALTKLRDSERKLAASKPAL